MSIEAVRKFINQHYPAAAGLAALGAALDARASETPLDPALATRLDELLAALGAEGILDDVTPQQAAPFVAELRHQLAFNNHLLHPRTRATSWSVSDPELLQEIGTFSSYFAEPLTRNIAPALSGLAERLHGPNGSFLDIGVGVGGLALRMAELWPNLRVVGIDVWEPSLEVARQNVARAHMHERIELRNQSIEHLDDEAAFDLIWLPMPFIPEGVLPEAARRMLRALRPGGWALFNFGNIAALDPATAALWRLRITTWGGPLLEIERVENLAKETGFAEVRTLPSPPGAPVAFTAARRADR